MDIAVPLLALLAKVDAVLTSQGYDPGDITTDDKILLAAQYIEVTNIMGLLDDRLPEKVRRL